MGKVSLVVKIFIRKISRGLWCKLRSSLDNFYAIEHRPNIIYNLNYNPLKKQKRVALVYLYDKNVNAPESICYHPNYYQHFVLIKVLISRDYIVDVYSCLDKSVDESYLENLQYDMILGFGAVYVQLCKLFPKARKILFITENAPWVVRKNFQERVDYYYQRHSQKITMVPRNGYYSDEMFEISDEGIAMNGTFNINSMKEKLKDIKQIFSNALPSKSNTIIQKTDFEKIRNRFVWFGSSGVVHKGLDVLIDAFSELPNLQLDVYGASFDETKNFFIPGNVFFHPKVDVSSTSFINDVIATHTFVLSLSCSEGMMSGIATCMMGGLVPIVTRETGYDDCPFVITFDDWHIESVKKQLLVSSSLSNDKLAVISKNVKMWAEDHNTNQSLYERLYKFIIY